MTPQNKKNIEKKLSYKFKKLIESYNSKRLLLEQVDTSHCKGQNFLLPITDEEYNKIPKGNDGKILFCKYKTPMGPMFIKAGSGIGAFKGFSKTKIDNFFKKYNITDKSAQDKVVKDVNTYIPQGVLSSFNNGTQYRIRLTWKMEGNNPPTVYSLGYVDSQGNPYKGPKFSIVKPVSAESVVTNLFSAYSNWKNDKEYWDEALDKKEFLKILDDDGNVREDITKEDGTTYSEEEINAAREQFKVFNNIQQKNNSELVEKLIDTTLSQLPEFTYVKILPDGKIEKLSEAPQEWSDEYGGYYSKTPPNQIEEAESGQKFSVRRPGYDKSRMYESNFKYKEYYSPIELKGNISSALEGINIDSARYENILKDELYKNEILLRIFKPEQIQKALTDCATSSAYDFLISIIEGYLIGPNGYPVGRYFMKDGQRTLELYVPKFNVNPEIGNIPCEDAFWYEYGIGIQMLLGLAAGVLYPVGGALFWAALFTDVVVNAYSLTKSMSAQDPERAKLDVAYIFLPFLVETQAFRGLIDSIRFGSKYKEIAKQLTQKLRAIPKVGDKYDLLKLKDFFENLSPDEAKLLKYLDKPEFKSVMKTAGREIAETVKKTKPKFKMSYFRRTLQTSSSIFFYGLPSAFHMYDVYINSINRTLGTPLTEQQTNFFNFILAHISEKDREKFANLKKEELMEFVRKADEMAQEKAKEILQAKEEEASLKAEKEFVSSFLAIGPSCDEITDDIRALAKKHGITIDCKYLDPNVKTAVENEKKELESEDSNN